MRRKGKWLSCTGVEDCTPHPQTQPSNVDSVIPIALCALTTTATRDQAEALARGAIENRLAGCAQVEGPVSSFYHWEKQVATPQEYRVWFKLMPAQAPTLRKWVLAQHPYDTPQWLEIPASYVGEKYLSWLQATSTPSPSSTDNHS